MGIPTWGNEKQMFESKVNEFPLSDRQRLYAVRTVYYDNMLNPTHSIPIHTEGIYKSMDELRKEHKDTPYLNAPILDVDNKLKTYRP